MIGRTISHYAILEKLGEGGMGVVYKAQDTKLDRTVALKFLPDRVTSNRDTKERFLQEAKSASALNHPNICTIFYLEEVGSEMFIVMEYVDGSMLRDRLPIRSLAEAVAFALQIAEGLNEAHAKGIVHRDIKADNIMVNSRNQAKVMDFGLAKIKGSMKLTKSSSTVGTLAYMAPEQVRGEEVDPRSDIFSFGVLLFEMLAGVIPFKGEHEAAVMYSLLNEAPEKMEKYRQDVPPALLNVIDRCLEKEPADRYQHTDDLVSDLRRIQKGTGSVIRPRTEFSPLPGGQSAPGAASSGTLPTGGATMPSSGAAIPARPGMPWKTSAAVGVLVALAVTAWLVLSPGPARAIGSIAVLPFALQGGDNSGEYLGDGLTEGLINSISKLPGVKVRSRSAVFRYKGKDPDPLEVGKELDVDALVLGWVTQKGNALSVSVELVDIAENTQIWGDQYEGTTAGVLALQNEISRELSAHLGREVSREVESSITSKPTENSEAYRLYLMARYHWNQRTADGINEAARLFQSAIEKDPGYALAYTGQAETYLLMAAYFMLPSKEAYSKAKAAATKAIELDPTLAEPRTALAVITSEYDWEFASADSQFRRAIELNPSYPTAHHWYAELLSARGKHQEAIAEVMKAIELDPLSPILQASAGWMYHMIGDYAKAVLYSDRALGLNPKFPRALVTNMQVAVQAGRTDDARRLAREALAASGGDIEYRIWNAYALGMTGDRDEARKIVDEVVRVAKDQYVSPILLAAGHMALGERDKAFAYLGEAYELGVGDMIFLAVEPTWAPLREDPRFGGLIKRVEYRSRRK